jgi:dynactin complex subunit
MLFEVDYSIKINGNFQTIYKEFIFAASVSECQYKAEVIRDELHQNKQQHVHIFIMA